TRSHLQQRSLPCIRRSARGRLLFWVVRAVNLCRVTASVVPGQQDDNTACARVRRVGWTVCINVSSSGFDATCGWPTTRPWRRRAPRVWLHCSLEALAEDLRAAGSRLVIRRGPTLAALNELIGASGATAVYWNRLYDPQVIACDTRIKSALKGEHIEAQSFNA